MIAKESQTVKFELYEYNPRRRARGVQAARLLVTWPDGESQLLWMSEKDIRENIKTHGTCQAMQDALKAYRENIFHRPDSKMQMSQIVHRLIRCQPADLKMAMKLAATEEIQEARRHCESLSLKEREEHLKLELAHRNS